MAVPLLRRSAFLAPRLLRSPGAVRTFTTSPSLHELVRKYTAYHEWITLDTATPTIATIGITKYAADALGDVVYIELPAVDAEAATGKPMGAVESVKSASDIYSPVDGTVVEVNEALTEKPGTVNRHPEGAGWMVKVRVGEGALEKEGLMGEDEYRKLTEK